MVGLSCEVIGASALTPDQLLDYVSAVSGLESTAVEGCIFHHGEGYGVLVAYPSGNPENQIAVDAAVAKAMEFHGLKQISVLSAIRPTLAPQSAESLKDAYWAIPIPPDAQSAKLRNMLKRAGKEINIFKEQGKEAWTKKHAELVEKFCKRRQATLNPGIIHIFSNLDKYLEKSPDAVLFSARNLNGKLCACAIGDYSSFKTAFYMFAFREPDAPPGTADALLAAVAHEGHIHGQTVLNLGLGIDSGIEFFKKKWGAYVFLPYIETSWSISQPKKSFFSRLFASKDSR